MAYSYLVSVGSTPTGPWVQFDNTQNINETITGLTPGQTYYFQLIPVDLASNIQGPASVLGPITPTLNPTTPGGLQLTNVTQTQVTLSWNPSV